MTQHVKAHRQPHLDAAPPEQQLPFEIAQQGRKRGVGARDDKAAFIEQGQGVAHRTALAALLRRQLFAMQAVERGLAQGKVQPGPGVEQVMHIARPGGDRPRVADTLFVVEAVFDRHNKMQRRTAARNKAARCSLLVEFVY